MAAHCTIIQVWNTGIMQPILTFSCTVMNIRDAVVEYFSKRMPAFFGVNSNSSR